MPERLAQVLAALGRPPVVAIRDTARLARLIGEAGGWVVIGWATGEPVRLSAIARNVVDMGVKALPLMAVFAAAVGAVMGMQVSNLLALADMLPTVLRGLANALSREIAPLLVGILIAARSGSTLAAGLGSMVVGQEIDALRGMGINPVRFLVSPALVAMIVVMPVLSVLLLATTLVAVGLYLSLTVGASPVFVVATALQEITAGDILLGLIKALVFAVLVTGVSASAGLAVKGGSVEVGHGVTAAIVLSITSVLIANAVLSLVFPA